MDCKIPVASIHSLVNEKFQMNIRYHDVFFMVKQLQNNKRQESVSEVESLLAVMEEMKKEDPTTRFAFEYEEGEGGFEQDLHRILVQTPKMHRNYRLYHDVVFMDATYKTNKNNMALTVFSGVNNEGRNVVLGYALVKRETLETYEWLLKTLVHMNGGVEPGVILTDFDPSMSGAIERVLKGSTHLLCQWHMQQNFKKHFIYLNRTKSCASKLLYKSVIDLIYCDCPQRFQQLQDLVFNSGEYLGPQKLDYLRKLFLIKEKWVTCFTPDIFSAGTHTISRAESVNS